MRSDFQPIKSAPRDGTVIGAWSPGEPAVLRLVRWGRHLNGPRQPEGWVTITRSVMTSNAPTHWIDLGPLPGAAGQTLGELVRRIAAERNAGAHACDDCAGKGTYSDGLPCDECKGTGASGVLAAPAPIPESSQQRREIAAARQRLDAVPAHLRATLPGAPGVPVADPTQHAYTLRRWIAAMETGVARMTSKQRETGDQVLAEMREALRNVGVGGNDGC